MREKGKVRHGGAALHGTTCFGNTSCAGTGNYSSETAALLPGRTTQAHTSHGYIQPRGVIAAQRACICWLCQRETQTSATIGRCRSAHHGQKACGGACKHSRFVELFFAGATRW